MKRYIIFIGGILLSSFILFGFSSRASELPMNNRMDTSNAYAPSAKTSETYQPAPESMSTQSSDETMNESMDSESANEVMENEDEQDSNLEENPGNESTYYQPNEAPG